MHAGGPGPGAENQGAMSKEQRVGVQQEDLPFLCLVSRRSGEAPPPLLSPLLHFPTSSGHTQRNKVYQPLGLPGRQAHVLTWNEASQHSRSGKAEQQPDVWPRYNHDLPVSLSEGQGLAP